MSKVSGTQRNFLFLLLAVSAFVTILLVPTSSFEVNGKTIALTREGKAALAVLAMAVLLWITEAIPFPITGLIAVNVLVITKAMPFADLVREGFGNEIVMFILGVMILSAAINETTLIRRVTALLLHRFGHRPRTVIFLFLLVGAMLSAWISDMAVAAILLPLGVCILRDARLEPKKSNFGRALMISCAWGPIIGGMATPAGCSPNPLTIGFLKELAGVDLSFGEWMLMGVPATILMIPFGWLVLVTVFRPEAVNLRVSHDDMRKQMAELGPLRKKDIMTLAIFSVTVFLWISSGWISQLTNGKIDYLGISYVVIACSCLFFLPGVEVLSWKQAEAAISWAGIILIVTGLSIGMAVYRTGAAEWLATVSLSRIGTLGSVGQIFLVVLGVSLLKVLFSSNAVTGTIAVPLLIALAELLEINPIVLALPAGMTSSLSFILVTSSPTNVIPYASGYFSIGDMAKAGLVMTIPSCICVTVAIYVFGHLFHILG